MTASPYAITLRKTSGDKKLRGTNTKRERFIMSSVNSGSIGIRVVKIKKPEGE